MINPVSPSMIVVFDKSWPITWHDDQLEQSTALSHQSGLGATGLGLTVSGASPSANP